MNPEIASFVSANIPPELVTLAIVLGGLSGTFFFVWGIIAPAIRWIRNSLFQTCFREIEVHVADPDFHKFNMWMNQNSQHTYLQRSFKIATSAGAVEEHDDHQPSGHVSALVPGFGSVLIKAPGMPFVWVMRKKEESKQVFKQTETLRFRVFSIRESQVDKFFDHVVAIKPARAGPAVFSSDGRWWDKTGTPKKVLAPIGASSKALVTDIQNFIDAEPEYRRRGISYKRGYMIPGPPGTGKSSLVAYISRYFDKDVYMLGSDGIMTFESLRGAVSPGSIILIEDIDMTIAGSKRSNLKKKKSDSNNPAAVEEKENEKMVTSETMREFLNVLDGLCEFDGCIVIITTNKPQALDAALLRPGRIDQTYEVGPYTNEEQIEHVNRFFDLDLKSDHPVSEVRTVAELQYLCVANMDNVDNFLAHL